MAEHSDIEWTDATWHYHGMQCRLARVHQLLCDEAGRNAALAGPARSDALLIVADALTDGARELDIAGRLGMAITLRHLGTVLRDEAPRRA